MINDQWKGQESHQLILHRTPAWVSCLTTQQLSTSRSQQAPSASQ